MANRFPLVINNGSTLVGELIQGDAVNLSLSGIFDGVSTGSTSQVLTSTGSVGVEWTRAADVFLDDAQVLLNKTFLSSTFDGSDNTFTNLPNTALLNSAITVNGNSVPLGGTVNTPNDNDNTTYALSIQDGSGPTQKRLRLTSGGTGTGFQDNFFNAAGKVTLNRIGTDTLEIGVTQTRLRANTNPFIDEDITLVQSRGTRLLQNGNTITIDSPQVPVGTIVMFNSTIAPAGWAICNGLNGTPDLRDRFIVSSNGTGFAFNETGGFRNAVTVDHTHDITTNSNTTAHSHTENFQADSITLNHNHGISVDNVNASHNHNGSASSGGSHTHGGGNYSSGGGGHGHSINFGGGGHNHPMSVGGHRHNVSSARVNGNTESGSGDGEAFNNNEETSSDAPNVSTAGGGGHGHNTSVGGGGHNHNVNGNSGPHNGHNHPVSVGPNNANHGHPASTNSTSSGADHGHIVSGNINNNNTFHAHTGTTLVPNGAGNSANGTDRNLPPYYALTFIMKINDAPT
jgi:hypothetical protein